MVVVVVRVMDVVKNFLPSYSRVSFLFPYNPFPILINFHRFDWSLKGRRLFSNSQPRSHILDLSPVASLTPNNLRVFRAS